MSNINNTAVYRGINRIFFIQPDLTIVEGGIFDIQYGVEVTDYIPGVFDPSIDLFDDHIYEGKKCISVKFKHYSFSFLGVRQFGPGHLHEKVIVSTNPDIPIDTTFWQTSKGDVYVLGTPIKAAKNGEYISDDAGEVKLWEVKPYLSRNELSDVLNNINAVSVFKEKMVVADVRAHQCAIEAMVQLSRATAAESSNISLSTILNSLLKKFEIARDKVINMKISTNYTLIQGAEKIESELDIDVPWDEVHKDDMKRTIDDINANVNFLQALKNMNPDPSDSVKEYCFNICFEVCGAEFLRRKLSMQNESDMQNKQMNTLAGLTTNYLTQQQKGNTSQDGILNSMNQLIDIVRGKYEANGRNIQQAVQDSNNELNGNRQFNGPVNDMINNKKPVLSNAYPQ